MFSHIMVGVNDLEASKRFYDAVFAVMGVGPGVAGQGRYYYRSATGTLGIITPINGQPATYANGGTIADEVLGPQPAGREAGPGRRRPRRARRW